MTIDQLIAELQSLKKEGVSGDTKTIIKTIYRPSEKKKGKTVLELVEKYGGVSEVTNGFPAAEGLLKCH